MGRKDRRRGKGATQRKNKSLEEQAKTTLSNMRAYGDSKRSDKQAHSGKVVPSKIYSISTMNNYVKQCGTFCKWIRTKHPHIKTLKEAKEHVPAYLRELQSKGKSASTVKTYAAALGKLYQVSPDGWYQKIGERKNSKGEVVPLLDKPIRYREDIIRGRKVPVTYHIDHGKNREVSEVIKCCGIRIGELAKIDPHKFTTENGKYYMLVDGTIGKGGRERLTECLDSRAYDFAQKAIQEGRSTLFEKKELPSQMNHFYRAEFALAVMERELKLLPPMERHHEYSCRKEMKGRVFDKRALAEVAVQLGHGRRLPDGTVDGSNRCYLVVSNYMYTRN